MSIDMTPTRDIVARTMNLLENEYDVEGLESFGMPTVDEITARIVAAYTRPTRKRTRKRTRMEYCDRHQPISRRGSSSQSMSRG
jgi:hypothetical protein